VNIDIAVVVRCHLLLSDTPTIKLAPPDEYRTYLPVAMAGFAGGQALRPHINSPININRSFSHHVRFARFHNSFLTPDKILSTVSASTGFVDDGIGAPPFVLTHDSLVSSRAILDASPESGMSGGPVIDAQCRVHGVTTSRSSYGTGGSLVRFSPDVCERIRAILERTRGVHVPTKCTKPDWCPGPV
jgi:hypothetical protein